MLSIHCYLIISVSISTLFETHAINSHHMLVISMWQTMEDNLCTKIKFYFSFCAVMKAGLHRFSVRPCSLVNNITRQWFVFILMFLILVNNESEFIVVWAIFSWPAVMWGHHKSAKLFCFPYTKQQQTHMHKKMLKKGTLLWATCDWVL